MDKEKFKRIVDFLRYCDEQAFISTQMATYHRELVAEILKCHPDWGV